MRHSIALAMIALLVCSSLLHVPLRAQERSEPRQAGPARPVVPSAAQAPRSPVSTRGDAEAARLPVRRVVLYKSGVGYFEHVGRVRGEQTVSIDLTSGQLDDVLKSLTTVDLGEGRVTGITFNSIAPLEQRLRAIGLPLDAVATRAELLTAIRGSRVEVQNGATPVVGRVLGIELRKRVTGETTEEFEQLTVVSDAGAVHGFELRGGVGVRLLDGDVRGDLSRYLDVVGSARTQDVRRMSIHTSGAGARDLFVSYVSEVPVWKSTYRLVIPQESGRTPFLQGWAVVDNTLGEDWTGIQLSLVAGAPQSFKHPLSQPVHTQRPTVPLATTRLSAPQTHDATLTTGQTAVSGTVVDTDGQAIPGVSVSARVQGAVVASTVSDANGVFAFTGLPAGAIAIEGLLSGFTTAFATTQVSPGQRAIVSLVMEVGALSEAVAVTSEAPAFKSGATDATRSGVVQMPRRAPAPPPAAAPPPPGFGAAAARLAQSQAAAQGADLGDLFEYALKAPVTIGRNQSALVPILQSPVTIERVSIWNAASGSARPLRAVWLTNDTGATLDGGAIALMEGNAFAGEGLLEPIKPRERRLISFAIDLAGRVTSDGSGGPRRISRVRIANGVMTQYVEERSTRTYTARNEDAAPRTFVIEHPKRDGWALAKGAVPAVESTSTLDRFRLVVPAGSSETLKVEEVHPVETRVAVSSLNDDHIALVLRGRNLDASTEPQLRAVIAQAQEVARLQSAIAQRAGEIERIESDQARVRQNLAALKTSAEERALVSRYATQIARQEDRLDVLRREVEEHEASLQQARAELLRRVNAVSIDVEMP